MNAEVVLGIVEQTLWITMMISAPLLLTALVMGLVVSIFQAATQINEMTLSFIPKLLAVFVMGVIAGPWMIRTFLDYTRKLFESIPGLIG
jgi:flagellar biosynthesis protein FliQ